MKTLKLSPEQLERKYAELGDKRAKERYKAEFVLIAHVSYITPTGTTFRTTKIPVARCFSRIEATRMKDRIKRSIRSKQLGYTGKETLYVEEYGPAPRIKATTDTGVELTEQIIKFEVLEKQVYLRELHD